jgi:hypothetical protein
MKTIDDNTVSEEIVLTTQTKQTQLIAHRNMLLQKSDKYLCTDFPITAESRQAIVEWRTELYKMEFSDSFQNDGTFEFPLRPQYERTDG